VAALATAHINGGRAAEIRRRKSGDRRGVWRCATRHCRTLTHGSVDDTRPLRSSSSSGGSSSDGSSSSDSASSGGRKRKKGGKKKSSKKRKHRPVGPTIPDDEYEPPKPVVPVEEEAWEKKRACAA
jgi:hypothetical protein